MSRTPESEAPLEQVRAILFGQETKRLTDRLAQIDKKLEQQGQQFERQLAEERAAREQLAERTRAELDELRALVARESSGLRGDKVDRRILATLLKEMAGRVERHVASNGSKPSAAEA